MNNSIQALQKLMGEKFLMLTETEKRDQNFIVELLKRTKRKT